MGTTIVIDDFKMVWREKKRGFLIGLLSQYGFMPLISYAFCFAFGFSNTAAIGVMLCGMMPGGSTSNLFTYWAKGNIALSMAMSAVSTIFACFMIPLLYLIYVQTTFAGTGADAVRLPALNFIMAIVCLMIPIPIGMLIRHKNTVKQCGCGCLKKPLFIYKWIEKVGGAAGAVFLLVAVIIGVLSAPQLISNPRIYWRSWVLGSIYQPIGCIFGYTMGRVARLDRRDCRAISLECGVQNYAIAIAVAALSFTGCVRTDVQTFVLVGSFWYVINSCTCTLVLRYICIKVDGFGQDGDNEEQTLKKDAELRSPTSVCPANPTNTANTAKVAVAPTSNAIVASGNDMDEV